MADLIDKQSVVDIVMCYCSDDDGSCSKADVDIRELLDEIENLPEIEYEPVRHGRWNEKGHCKCCGYDMGSRVDKWTNVYNLQFCPNCGARMDRGADNAESD